MMYALNCKFCKKPISVEVDDDYASLGDPYKLLSFAACNHCADLRVKRRLLADQIRSTCARFSAIRNPTAKVREDTSSILGKLLKTYAELIAEWHGKEGYCWDDAIVETVLASPNQWGEVLGRLWTMYRQWEARGEPAP